MVESARQGLFAKQCLTTREMREVEHLAMLCNAHEGLRIRLDYTMCYLSTLPTDDLFLFYQRNALLGSLLLDRYHSDMKEVTGMVHPDFRRQGIFHTLFAAASQESRRRGIKRLLFPCETTSLSGQAFLQHIAARQEFAEHRMVLRRFQPRLCYDAHLHVRAACFDDLEKLTVVLAADFHGNREHARQHLLQTFEHPHQQFYLATYGSAESAEPMGMLRVEEEPAELGVYGFFVRPEYRGRGHGRQILEETIVAVRQRSQKQIILEVDMHNLTALNLYLSLGFIIERTYEYYGLSLA
jgi:ribosomal protein S18 acetylase RimI-like enzyme